MKPYLDDPSVMAKIKMVQQNPSLMTTVLSDPKMMEMLGILMGQSQDESSSSTPIPASTKKKEETAKPMEVEEDWSNLSPKDREKKETEKNARLKKEEGNGLYKAKKFEEALAAYDEAFAIDPTCMTFLLNKAAVYFAQKKYDDCIEECMKATEVGKENMAPFEDRAKAFTRCAKAYQKKRDLGKAIEMCKAAQLESYSRDTQRLMKPMELEKKKKDKLDYQNSDKAEEAKQRGNNFFREKKFAESIAEYEDAVKRAPKDAPIRNNLSAALTKIMDFNGAKTQVEKALELYQKGLGLDSTNQACKDGLRKVTQQINYGRANMTDEQKQEQKAHAMADPQIQSILQDPVVQQVLRDFGENPDAAQKAMLDPGMRAKIQKLIAAGVVETA